MVEENEDEKIDQEETEDEFSEGDEIEENNENSNEENDEEEKNIGENTEEMEQEDSEEDNPKGKKKKKDKGLFILVGVVIVIFIVILCMRFLYNPKTTGMVTLEGLHEKNLEGEETENNYVYNGFSFAKQEGLWYTELTKIDKWGQEMIYNLPLHFGPKELEYITIEGESSKMFGKAEALFITFDPYDENLKYISLAATELSLSLTKILDKQVIGTCAKEAEGCETRPIVTCDNTDEAVIFLRNGDKESIVFEGNCIIVEGKDMGLVKGVDRLLLYWIRAMKS